MPCSNYWQSCMTCIVHARGVWALESSSLGGAFVLPLDCPPLEVDICCHLSNITVLYIVCLCADEIPVSLWNPSTFASSWERWHDSRGSPKVTNMRWTQEKRSLTVSTWQVYTALSWWLSLSLSLSLSIVVFKVYDIDRDGKISKDDLRHVSKLIFQAIGSVVN